MPHQAARSPKPATTEDACGRQRFPTSSCLVLTFRTPLLSNYPQKHRRFASVARYPLRADMEAGGSTGTSYNPSFSVCLLRPMRRRQVPASDCAGSMAPTFGHRTLVILSVAVGRWPVDSVACPGVRGSSLADLLFKPPALARSSSLSCSEIKLALAAQ
jgi:hypothetical protein